jgi:EpsI family protein
MSSSKSLIVRCCIFVAVLATALAGAETLRPTHYLAKDRAPIDLQAQVPTSFGEWSEVQDMKPLLPDPELQKRLDALYTQVLARTYVNPAGKHMMLSIAYGSDQSSEATAVHRPEFCYGAQGFRVTNLGVTELQLPGGQLPLQRLLTKQGTRIEPVMYWVTLNTTATLPGLGRKLAQLDYGLKGEIADGMLVRVSSIESTDPEAQFAAQKAFLADLHAAMPAAVRAFYFGS